MPVLPIAGPSIAGSATVTDLWSSTELLTRVGLPVLLILIGFGLIMWGRRERSEAAQAIVMLAGYQSAEIGPRSGHSQRADEGATKFGSVDGLADGLGGSPGAPNPLAGRAKMIGGGISVALGVVALIVVTSVRVFSG